ncbi:hypothetical protein SAMN02745824_2114 [Parasphingorhabdus marina DSM 22363]|uniref:Secreted protein n=1 Tax=Parasphingorhabdus marina DSM 22363 TaxID=1123272 RepID=A0A1N6EVU5_9SPHN|nr:hypothetical protein [Parasphingorhabdus marina]SIN87179.1 hypothetical protein SAMN02745824_2114 [Parasphingorhabdus marina DSM 22363]
MFKQVLILAGSVIAIAVAVASTAGDSPEKPAPAETREEVKKTPAAKPVTTDDSYYDDDENFVFGEPLTYDEDNNSGASASASDYPAGSGGRTVSAASPGSALAKPGSKENPINVMPAGVERQVQ